MLGFLSFAFFIIGFALAYWLWIRPMLRGRPAFADFYARTDSLWSAFWLKLNTIKTKFLAVLTMVASGLVSLHDFLMPLIPGIDWSPLTTQAPAWVWPIASFLIAALFLWFRQLTARTQEKEVLAVAAGATPDEAKVAAGILPSVMPENDEADDG